MITDKAFLAKGGEYAVASELMFREFNVSIMVVDKGVDLVVEKNNKYFNIQVKTAEMKALIYFSSSHRYK